MSYQLTPTQVNATTQVQVAWGTTDLLPPLEEIPQEFHSSANIHHQIVAAIFYGSPLPDGDVTVRDGFAQDRMVDCVRAHLKSWGPKHEHKMAGVAYMLSLMAQVEPARQSESSAPERSRA